MSDHLEEDDTDAVLGHRDVERQMQGVALLFATGALYRAPAGHTGFRGRSVHCLANAGSSLPAVRQDAVQRNGSLPLVNINGLAEQQARDLPAEQHQMVLVADRPVLTQETGKISIEPVVGIHEGLFWGCNPKLSWFPVHLMA